MLPIILRLAAQHIAAARAVLCPRVEHRALLRAEVLEIPTLTCCARAVGSMGTHAVLVVRRLTVRQDALLVDRQPEPVRESRRRLRHRLDLRGGRGFAAEAFRRRIHTSEECDADAPAVAQIRRGKQVIEYAVPMT